jgi:hypothetical protein
MAQTNKQGYDISLDIFSIKGVTPRDKGTFEDDNGKEVQYKEAVTIDLIRVVDVSTDNFGLIPKEFELHIVIPCEDLKEAQLLFKHILKMKENNVQFSPSVLFPKKVKSSLGGLEFMSTHMTTNK